MLQILKFFNWELAEAPKSFGWMHILFFVLTIAGAIVLPLFGRNMKENNFKKTLLIGWIVLVTLEVLKQVTWSINWDLTGTAPVFKSYSWYTFPFQMCATPMYVLPFAIFFKNKKIENAACAYLMTFAMFAGMVVIIYPNDVFVKTLFINIQSLTYHGLMFVLGVFIACYKRKELTLKYFLGALFPYTAVIAIAVLLNETMFYVLGKDEGFNMFFISTHHDSTLLVLSNLNGVVHPVVRIFIYYAAFATLAFTVYLIDYFFAGVLPELISKAKEKRKAKEAESVAEVK